MYAVMEFAIELFLVLLVVVLVTLLGGFTYHMIQVWFFKDGK